MIYFNHGISQRKGVFTMTIEERTAIIDSILDMLDELAELRGIEEVKLTPSYAEPVSLSISDT